MLGSCEASNRGSVMLDDSKHCIRTIEIFARHQTSCIYRDLIILSIRTINAISEHNNLHVAI